VAKTYTVVGRLCDSRADALIRLQDIRSAFEDDPRETTVWGLVKIHKKADTLRLPLPPSLLRRLEGLLTDREVRRTKAGRSALEMVRAAQGKRR